jgi:HlyD family secretion protein
MKRWVRRIAILVVLAGAAVALRFTVFRTDPVPVTIFRAAPGRVEESVTNSRAGTVRSRLRAALSPEIGGRVADLPARKGEPVRRGHVLLRLSDEEYRARVALEERSVEAARASERAACLRADQAERALQRQIRLADEEIVSADLLDRAQSERDVAVAACEEARARVLQSQASLEAARVALARTVIRAPFDGVVADLSTEVGEWITPSPPGLPIPPVLDLIDPDSIYVSAPLDEVDVGRVAPGLPVRITMDAFPGRSFPGRVVRVAPYVVDVQDRNRTFEIEAEFEDSTFARTLLPGTSADVEVILKAREGVLRVPSYALREGGGVLVLRGGTLEAVTVKTGLRNWEYAEILDGLSPGDAVVVSLDRAEVRAGVAARAEEETPR